MGKLKYSVVIKLFSITQKDIEDNKTYSNTGVSAKLVAHSDMGKRHRMVNGGSGGGEEAHRAGQE